MNFIPVIQGELQILSQLVLLKGEKRIIQAQYITATVSYGMCQVNQLDI